MIYTVIIGISKIVIIWVRNPMIKKTFQTLYIVVFSVMVIDNLKSKKNIQNRYEEYNNFRSNGKSKSSI